MSTPKTSTQKTPKTGKHTVPAAITVSAIKEAMTAVGYESFRAMNKIIKIEVPGGKRDRLGNKRVAPISVHDIVLAPGALTNGDGEWPAVQVATDLLLAYSDIQLFGTGLVLRDVRDLQE